MAEKTTMLQTGKIWIFYDPKNKKQSKPLNLTQAQALILNLAQKKNFQAYIWTPGWNEWVDLKSFLEADQDYFVVPPSVKKKPLDKTSVTKTLTRFRESKTAITTTVADNLEKTLLVPLDPSNLIFKEPKPTFTEVSNEAPNQKIDYGYFYPDFKIENIDLQSKQPKIRLKTASQGHFGTAENIKMQSSVSADRRENIRYNFAIEIILITKKGKTFKSQSENISISGVKLKDAIPREFLMTDFSIIIANKLEKDPKKARIHFNSKCVGDVSDAKRLVFVNPDQKSQSVLEEMISSYIQQVRKKEKAG